jgi:protein-ribulosamine 3-kinase
VNLPDETLTWLRQRGSGEVTKTTSVGGGCINNGMRLSTESGESFFLKFNHNAPQDMFAREAEGLEALAVPNGPRIPEPYCHGPTFILLEDLHPGRRQKDYWERFGQQLAALHGHTHEEFGFEHDNYCGRTPQPNPWTPDGYEFFAVHRLRFQANLAQQAGLLSTTDLGRVDRLSERLPDLVPAQPASLIHGDLWTGNAETGPDGEPALIDPAAHFGWAEAELGMTTLFGSFPAVFYRAYEEVRTLDPDWRARLPLYNLYHLLNHLNLFGRSYLPQVQNVLNRFA